MAVVRLVLMAWLSSRPTWALSGLPKAWVPTALTAGRVLAVPVVSGAVIADKALVAQTAFALAGVTDLLDGYLARRWRVESALGAFLDPVADKLMICATLVSVSARDGVLVGIATAIIVSREIAVSALREWAAQRNQRHLVKVNSAGKLKTTLQFLAVFFLLGDYYHIGLPLLYVAAILTVQSGALLFRQAKPLFFPKQTEHNATPPGGAVNEEEATDKGLRNNR